MADRRGYDIIWKKGSWFEKGGWVLKPRKSFSEKAGETIVIYLILGVILFLSLSIIVLTLPIWSVLIGLQMVREKRYIAGIISVFALGYFYIDVNNQWLTSFVFTGNYNSEGESTEAFFGLKYLEYLAIFNLVAVGLGIGYIFDAVLISRYGKKVQDNRITAPQAVIYLVPVLLAFIFSSSISRFENNTDFSHEMENPIKTDERILNASPSAISDIGNEIDSINYTTGNDTLTVSDESTIVFFKSVEITNQTWMQKNLDVNSFRNGDLILEAKTIEEWKEAGKNMTPAWCYYENKKSTGIRYGKLYNWYAVNDIRGLAPLGWHIASNDEWEILLNNLGENSQRKIKASNGWKDGRPGNNSSGFTSLPAGIRGSTMIENSEVANEGEFFDIGYQSNWWTSTEEKNSKIWAVGRWQCCDVAISEHRYINKSIGMSVRCIKD